MIITGKFICVIGAIVCFTIRGLGISTGRIDLMNLGFALLTASNIL